MRPSRRALDNGSYSPRLIVPIGEVSEATSWTNKSTRLMRLDALVEHGKTADAERRRGADQPKEVPRTGKRASQPDS